MIENISASNIFDYVANSSCGCFTYYQDEINLENFNYYNGRLVSTDNEKTPIEQFINDHYSDLVKYKPNKDETNKKKAINSIITNLLSALNAEKVVAISRTTYDYSIPKQYKLDHIKYNYIVKPLDQLICYGFVEQAKGFYNIAVSGGKLTRIWASEKLVSEINNYCSSYYIDPDVVKVQESKIILPKSIGGVKKEPFYTPIILKDSLRHLKKYCPTKKTMKMESDLRDYNSFIASNSILSSLSNSSNLNSEYLYQIQLNPLLDKKSNNLLIYKELDGNLHRVFNKSKFTLGGRFYGAEYQKYNEDERSSIFINGNKTLELDFSNQHLQMIYNLAGLSLESDGYLILGEEYRPLMKVVSLITINSSNPNNAFRGFNKQLSRDKKLYKLYKKCGLKTPKLFEIFANAHPKISKFFNSGIGLALQYIDSIIAERVISHFAKQGTVCLTIHDSFIVEEKLKQELESIMNESYKNKTGFNCMIKGGK